MKKNKLYYLLFIILLMFSFTGGVKAIESQTYSFNYETYGKEDFEKILSLCYQNGTNGVGCTLGGKLITSAKDYEKYFNESNQKLTIVISSDNYNSLGKYTKKAAESLDKSGLCEKYKTRTKTSVYKICLVKNKNADGEGCVYPFSFVASNGKVITDVKNQLQLVVEENNTGKGSIIEEGYGVAKKGDENSVTYGNWVIHFHEMSSSNTNFWSQFKDGACPELIFCAKDYTSWYQIKNEDDKKYCKYYQTISPNSSSSSFGENEKVELPSWLGDPYEKLSCEELIGDELKGYIQQIVNIIKIVVPILLIVFGTIDFGKAIFVNDEGEMKKSQTKFIKRLIIAVAFFLVPTLLTLILNIAHNIWPSIEASLCGITF